MAAIPCRVKKKKEWVSKPSSVPPHQKFIRLFCFNTVVSLFARSLKFITRINFWCGATAIYLDQLLPVGSPAPIELRLTPNRCGKRPTRWLNGKPFILGPSITITSCLVLQAVGFALPAPSPTPRCALTAPFHHCLPNSQSKFEVGCVFSVALSRGSPRVAVSHHRALSCSDFPPARHWRTSGRMGRKVSFRRKAVEPWPMGTQ